MPSLLTKTGGIGVPPLVSNVIFNKSAELEPGLVPGGDRLFLSGFVYNIVRKPVQHCRKLRPCGVTLQVKEHAVIARLACDDSVNAAPHCAFQSPVRYFVLVGKVRDTCYFIGRYLPISLAYLRKNVAACSRVTISSGAKRLPPTPEVIPFAAAHATALLYHDYSGTSVNGLGRPEVSGLPARRYRTVTSIARDMGISGLNRGGSVPVPIIRPLV